MYWKKSMSPWLMMLDPRRSLILLAHTTKSLKLLPKILRFTGAIALIASAAVFMFQSWDVGDHFLRYFSFLGFTASLALAGFFCGIKVKEDKGARTFLGIAAAIVPVHFCVIGALIYANAVEALPHLPFYAFWQVADATQLLIIAVSGLLVLTPLTFVAFSSLVRKEAVVVTVAYLTANALLLIPTRNPDTVALIGLLLICAVGYIDAFVLRLKTVMKTREGKFVRSMLIVPFILLVIRTAYLHHASMLFLSMLFFATAVFLFVYIPIYVKHKGVASVSQGYSTLPLAIGWGLVVTEYSDYVPNEIIVPFAILPYAVALIYMSLHAVGGGAVYRAVSAVLATGALFINLVSYPSLASSFLCIGASILTLAYGYTSEYRSVFYIRSKCICAWTALSP